MHVLLDCQELWVSMLRTSGCEDALLVSFLGHLATLKAKAAAARIATLAAEPAQRA